MNKFEMKTVSNEYAIDQMQFENGHSPSSFNKLKELEALVDLTAEQNERLVNFTYVISHNIRSHVANIIGIINLNESGDEFEKEMSWDMIKKCISGLDATIHNLNHIIDIKTNINLPVKQICVRNDLNRILTSVNMLYKNIDMEINYHFDDSTFLETNPAYLESIILNLLTNAIKYKSAERPLQIDLSFNYQGCYKIFVFKDNGRGIDLNANGDKVFGMYKTFHGNADAKGLGLFLIKSQIEALGGKIEVESVLNESTTFKVYFKEIS